MFSQLEKTNNQKLKKNIFQEIKCKVQYVLES